MRIQSVEIKNFRNFKHLVAKLGHHAVIAGENRAGKTNFLFALGLILDPSMPDSMRELQDTDFWDGLHPEERRHAVISISVELTEFENDENIMTTLNSYLISGEPMVARLTYEWRPMATIEGVLQPEPKYEFLIFGGDDENRRITTELRRRIPFELLKALRDAEGDLSTWKRSPLKPLIVRARKSIPEQRLEEIATLVHQATTAVTSIEQISTLSNEISGRLRDLAGDEQDFDPQFGFSPTEPDSLLRSMRLFIDSGRRGVGDASLGSANLLFLALKTLELKGLVDERMRDHSFLGIEEPEAHLHPHLQRLVYRDLLRVSRIQDVAMLPGLDPDAQTILLTTHSPHIVSVAPLSTMVLLRREWDEDAQAWHTVAYSPIIEDFTEREIADLERYLDVTRAEMLFAKGVILVEGEAEKYIVPRLAQLLDPQVDLDKLGITVCSISGADFRPYARLLGKSGFNIPHVILTDLDPQTEGHDLGYERVCHLLELVMEREDWAQLDTREEVLDTAKDCGIFLNDSTLETDLFHAGQSHAICDTLIALTTNGAAARRAEQWNENPTSLVPERFIKDINAIGKGRFAQRLAPSLVPNACPPYIEQAVRWLVARIGDTGRAVTPAGTL